MSVFDDEVLTIDDLARYLKLKRQTIYRWAQRGKLPGAKIGKEWRFRRSVIEEWIVKNLGAPQGAPPAANGDTQSDGETTLPPRREREPRKEASGRRKRNGPEKN